MPLAPGTWLNHYQILGHLGTGGMGEVYRALDNKLQREVALKILPKAFAQDPERLARFRREAQVLAQLNHVNIAAIHNLEQSGETHFLVMELALGETLRDRIKGSREQGTGNREQMGPLAHARGSDGRTGGIPLEEALEICKQIAAGLECAHEKPIVHRDLKPANIKVSPEGVVKILDFGLARAFAGDNTSSDPADSPTLSAMTAPGTILGTAAYMSPEQARGKKVDKRTDIWALGCVLYELLTGQQAFDPSRDRERAAHPSPDRKGGVASPAEPPLAGARGSDSDQNTIADIIGAVLYKEPDWTALPETTPHWVRVLLRRCLEKDAKRRLSSAADLQIQIEEALTAPATAPPSIALRVPTRPVWQRASPWAAAVVVSIAVGIGAWMLKPTQQQPVTRVTITLPLGQRLAALDQPAIAISPDGKNIVYVAIQSRDSNGAANQSPDRQGGVASSSEPPLPPGRGSDSGTQQLYLRPLDSQEAKPIAGTEGAVGPFFSPDGQWIGFFAGGRLKKVSVNGGAAVTLASAPNPGGASWSNEGTLALQPTIGGQGLQQVPQEGGAPQPLTRVGKGEFLHRWPEWLPNGQAVLFAAAPNVTNWSNAQIAVQVVETGERRNLVQGGTQPRYASSGHLLYAQAGTLMAAPFDLRNLAMRGAAAPVLEDVLQSTAAAQYSVSATGTLVYVAGGVEGSQRRLVWLSRNGEEQALPAPPHTYQYPRVSPDGRRVAVAIEEPERQVWLYDLARDTLTRLTFEGNDNSIPAWTPDGKRVAFRSNRAGPANLFWQLADGSGGLERLTTSDYSNSPSSFSPDGQLLAFHEAHPTTGRDIWVLRLSDPSAGSGQVHKAQPFLRTQYDEGSPRFSPDGRWLAYSSNESSRYEVYVQPYPGPGGKWLISTEGGGEPVWNPDGRELFYRSGNKMMAVEVTTQPGFAPGKPRLLFEGSYMPTITLSTNYDVSPDGQRFLMLKPVESQTSAPTQIHVVLNWFEELKRRVPPGQ